MEFKGSKTQKNLIAAFGAECMARVKYELYAEQARRDGFENIADVFDETADNELAHAAIWMGRLGGFDTVGASLKDSAKGEAYEYEEMYRDYAAVADDEGFTELAKLFRRVGKIERAHRDRFNSLSRTLEKGETFARDTEVVWVCLNCGYAHKGKAAPEICPTCAHPQAFFTVRRDDD